MDCRDLFQVDPKMMTYECTESLDGKFADVDFVASECSVASETLKFEAAIRKLEMRDWPRRDAIVYRLLSTVNGAIGRALRPCRAVGLLDLRGR